MGQPYLRAGVVGDKMFTLCIRMDLKHMVLINTHDNILKINSVLPELMITHGDIRQLDFDDGSFHGYWSWGVIEHYMDGYDSIRTEMFRVIQNHGYLFLTVPTMSLLRETKASMRLKH